LNAAGREGARERSDSKRDAEWRWRGWCQLGDGEGTQWSEFVWETRDEDGSGLAAMPDDARQDCGGLLLCAAAGGDGVVEGCTLRAVTA